MSERVAEKVRFLVRLLELFPQATEADGELCWQRVLERPVEVALQAIDAHREELGAKAFRPDPLKVGAIAASLGGADGRRFAAATARVLAEQKHRGAEIAAEKERVDRILAGLSDQEFERLRPAALERIPPAARWAASRRPTRESPLLRYQVAQLAEGVGVGR